MSFNFEFRVTLTNDLKNGYFFGIADEKENFSKGKFFVQEFKLLDNGDQVEQILTSKRAYTDDSRFPLKKKIGFFNQKIYYFTILKNDIFEISWIEGEQFIVSKH